MLGILHCSVCADSWYRDMTNIEIAAFRVEHPNVDPSQVTEVDLGETLCDGCEDFFNDEYALQRAEDEEIEAQYLDELKEDACAAAGTGEFAEWHFDPEIGDN